MAKPGSKALSTRQLEAMGAGARSALSAKLGIGAPGGTAPTTAAAAGAKTVPQVMSLVNDDLLKAGFSQEQINQMPVAQRNDIAILAHNGFGVGDISQMGAAGGGSVLRDTVDSFIEQGMVPDYLTGAATAPPPPPAPAVKPGGMMDLITNVEAGAGDQSVLPAIPATTPSPATTTTPPSQATTTPPPTGAPPAVAPQKAKGRGRPPGAKNKSKGNAAATTTAAPATAAAGPAATTPPPAAADPGGWVYTIDNNTPDPAQSLIQQLVVQNQANIPTTTGAPATVTQPGGPPNSPQSTTQTTTPDPEDPFFKPSVFMALGKGMFRRGKDIAIGSGVLGAGAGALYYFGGKKEEPPNVTPLDKVEGVMEKIKARRDERIRQQQMPRPPKPAGAAPADSSTMIRTLRGLV